MRSMYIGSGDTAALLSGRDKKGHLALLCRFVSDTIPYYNALASPIDAFRIGAITEDRFYQTLSDEWYPQVKVVCAEMDCLRATLDFARIDRGHVAEFIECKSVFMTDFIEIEACADLPDVALKIIKTTYKSYYNQVQQQLLCSGLPSARLVFICVYNYDDEMNRTRDISARDCLEFIIERDEAVIERIKDRATIFQQIKDYYTKN